MQPDNQSAVTSITQQGRTLSLCEPKKLADIEKTFCAKYIDLIDAVAIGECDKNESSTRNALVALVKLGSDHHCRSIRVVTSAAQKILT